MMAITNQRIESALRFKRWKEKQNSLRKRKGETEAVHAMEANRVRFSGFRQMNVDSSIFLESVIEGNDLMPSRYFELGKLATKPVGRIHFDLGPRIGQGFATGFLVAPSLLLTNHHVLPSMEIAQAATVTFDAEDGIDGLPRTPSVFRLQPQRLYLADKALDFCFVAVSGISNQGARIEDFGYLKLHRGTGKILRNEYATIVQHPRGRQKHVAVRNNEVIVYVYDNELDAGEANENNHIYYSTDTLPGSSGAPVFSDQWYVVALHRRGVPKTRTMSSGEMVAVRRDNKLARADDPDDAIQFEANEGVRVSRILKQVELLAQGSTAESATAKIVLNAIHKTTGQADGGPFWSPTSPVNRTSGRLFNIPDDADFLEVTHRPATLFDGAKGFDPRFLGIKIGLPILNDSLEAAVARRIDKPDEFILPFHHFTTVVHAKRRLPIFAAVNIDGEAINTSKKPNRPAWSYDPRLDEAHQPDDSIFSTMVQRGHMAAREFMWWGADGEARNADIHSFTLSNVCPQIGKFNGSREWYKLERLIMGTAKKKNQRVNCFMGPIFSDDDPLYDDLRSDRSSAEFGTGIRMPLQFWYVLAWREGSKLKHRGFILDQSDDIDDAGPLEFEFDAPATVVEVSITEIMEKTGLSFPDLSV
jgi:endonuclease G